MLPLVEAMVVVEVVGMVLGGMEAAVMAEAALAVVDMGFFLRRRRPGAGAHQAAVAHGK